MKKMTIFLIIGLSLVVVTAIGLPGNPEGTSTLHRASNSLWNAIKAGAEMELIALANCSELSGTAVSEVPAEPNQR